MKNDLRIEDVIVQRYSPQAGDVLFVKVPARTRPEEVKSIHRHLAARLPVFAKVVVITDEVDVQVVRPGTGGSAQPPRDVMVNQPIAPRGCYQCGRTGSHASGCPAGSTPKQPAAPPPAGTPPPMGTDCSHCGRARGHANDCPWFPIDPNRGIDDPQEGG